MIGEANFSDHGANRLGASALMQGLADGYFVLPYTIGDLFARTGPGAPSGDAPEFREAVAACEQRTRALLAVNGQRTAGSFHRELGRLMWNDCGMARNETGLLDALERIPAIRQEFWENVRVPGSGAARICSSFCVGVSRLVSRRTCSSDSVERFCASSTMSTTRRPCA